MNLLWPRYLGGTPRWYKMVSGTPNQSSLSAVKKLSEDGTWSPVIDSEWEMEDALKVCQCFSHPLPLISGVYLGIETD